MLKSIELGSGNPQQDKVLQTAQTEMGFVPNLIKKLANSPVAAEAYLTLNELFQKSSFSAAEQQLILLTISRFHQCEYCVAAHSMLAEMNKLPKEIIEAIRNHDTLQDSKLAALHNLVEEMVIARGNPDETFLNAFFEAGYQPNQLLDIILAISLKTLSNYTNHIAHTELDEMITPYQWES